MACVLWGHLLTRKRILFNCDHNYKREIKNSKYNETYEKTYLSLSHA